MALPGAMSVAARILFLSSGGRATIRSHIVISGVDMVADV